MATAGAFFLSVLSFAVCQSSTANWEATRLTSTIGRTQLKVTMMKDYPDMEVLGFWYMPCIIYIVSISLSQ
jgi:hypothetical protein